MLKIYWKYKEEYSKVQHAFYAAKGTVSVCGTTLLWYGNDKWKDDEGLKNRKRCKRCLRILNIPSIDSGTGKPGGQDHLS